MTDKYTFIGGRGSAKTFITLKTTELFLENEQLKDRLKQLEKENKLLLQYAAYCYYGYNRPMKLINKIGKLLEKQK